MSAGDCASRWLNCLCWSSLAGPGPIVCYLCKEEIKPELWFSGDHRSHVFKSSKFSNIFKGNLELIFTGSTDVVPKYY